MNKLKISSGLAASLLVAGLFAGWTTLLIVAVILLVFCEIDDKTKGIMTKVITFLIGLSLFSMAWSLIYDGINLIISSFDNIIATINSYLDYSDMIDVTKMHAYLLTPISNISNILNNIVDYLIVFAKFGFLLSIIVGKGMKENFITKKINEFVNKALNFVNSFEFGQTEPQQNPGFANAVQQPQQMQYQNVVQQNTQFPNQNMPQ